MWVDDELKGFGTLARYVVSSAISEPTPDVDYEKLQELVQSKSLLPILLGGLPSDTLKRVSEVLGRWVTEAVAAGADEKELKKVIKLNTKLTDPFKLREALNERLMKSPLEFGAELARLFKKTPLSFQLMSDFSSALAPRPPSGQSGESVLEEARRNGDLMPGEGT